MRTRRSFKLLLIKPSHYDDNGYVIQWARSAIPSNTLAVLYGLALDCARRQVLGTDVDIIIEVIDETNTRVRTDRIIRRFARNGGRGMVGLVGVQSNQFPRAMDIARPLRRAGIPVCIGGFHVSGCLAMLPEVPDDLREAQSLGVSLFAGEVEGRFDSVLRDADAGALQPLYNYLAELPALDGEPTPYLPAAQVRRTIGRITTFDAGRGCPFECSFCTIINVQGRRSRRRSPDDIERLIRANAAQGVFRYFVTDDNFARNKDWEAILDRIITLREDEDIPVRMTIQVDTMCHRTPRFIEKCARAGVRRVFIGLESINPEALQGAKKRQNKHSEFQAMMLAWRRVKVTTFAGYILGFPADTAKSIERDIETIQGELPVDFLEFFMLTPLPGSEDHKRLFLGGVPMDADMNAYDVCHATVDHPLMSREEWKGAYEGAWRSYYAPAHVETILRRAAASRISLGKTLLMIIWMCGSAIHERVHPMEGGYLRQKVRTQRRPGLPIENPLVFYPRRVWETVSSTLGIAGLAIRYIRISRRIRRDPRAGDYRDEALSALADREPLQPAA